MSNKLESLHAQTLAAEEEERKANQAADQKERDKVRADRDAKAEQERIGHEEVLYHQSNVMIDRIESAVGKQGLKDPRLSIVVFWLMMQGRDGLGRNTPEAGLGALEAYYRTAERLEKEAKK